MSFLPRKHCITCRCAEPLSALPPIAPWPDYEGKPIQHGDRLRHPDGMTFVAVRINDQPTESDAWRCMYDGPELSVMTSRLCLQIGDKGQAVVI
jgi:hypothetical protein